MHSFTTLALSAESEALWQDLVNRLGEDVPHLVDDFLNELQSSGLYKNGLVSRVELATSAQETFELLVARLRSGELSSGTESTAKRLGRERARQGVDMQDLVDAVQLDFPVLWRRLHAHAEGRLLDVLMGRVELIHLAVERYSFAVREEFIRETARIERNVSIAFQRHLKRLFSPGPLSENAFADIATGLGITRNSTFELAVIAPDFVAAARARITEEMTRGELFGLEIGTVLMVLRPSGSAVPMLEKSAGDLGGVLYKELAGLPAVGNAGRGGTELLRVNPGLQQLHDARDLLSVALINYARRLVPGYLADEESALATLAESDGRSVIDTVRAYLDCGSVKATASRLHCHRNTVVNRLHSFASTTGLDVTVPKDSSVALLLISMGDT